jgi:NADP-reducing hydrogenase subunit HndB
MPKLTLDDLNKIREKAKSEGVLKSGGRYRVKVTVHMGTCGIAAGARDIMTAFLEQIQEAGVNDVYLTNSGCAGLCSREPMITIEHAGKTAVKYVDLNVEKVKEIFKKDVMAGHPIPEYALAFGSERSI